MNPGFAAFLAKKKAAKGSKPDVTAATVVAKPKAKKKMPMKKGA